MAEISNRRPAETRAVVDALGALLDAVAEAFGPDVREAIDAGRIGVEYRTRLLTVATLDDDDAPEHVITVVHADPDDPATFGLLRGLPCEHTRRH